MSPARRSAPCHIRYAAALALGCALAPAGLAANMMQWRVEASVPVICEIVGVDSSGEAPGNLAIATSCNAARFQLVLHDSIGETGLLSARSSAGPVAINGRAVTITSTQPGYALTTIQLAAPAVTERMSVTLLPI